MVVKKSEGKNNMGVKKVGVIKNWIKKRVKKKGRVRNMIGTK